MTDKEIKYIAVKEVLADGTEVVTMVDESKAKKPLKPNPQKDE